MAAGQNQRNRKNDPMLTKTGKPRLGLSANFFSVWLEVWALAYPVAIVCILIYRPFSSKLTDTLLEKLSRSSH